MKKVYDLYSGFKPKNYKACPEPNGYKVVIGGYKIGRPSRRITLHQRNLKIRDAKIIKMDKKRGSVEISLSRINHHKSFQELRLHSTEMLYPGSYRMELTYSLSPEKLRLLEKGFYSRETMPSIDVPEAWAQAEVQVKR